MPWIQIMPGVYVGVPVPRLRLKAEVKAEAETTGDRHAILKGRWTGGNSRRWSTMPASWPEDTVLLIPFGVAQHAIQASGARGGALADR